MVPDLEKHKITEIHVRMDCKGCVKKMKKAIHDIDGIYDLYIDYSQQKLTIVGGADPETILKAIKKRRKTATLCSHSEVSNAAAKPPAEPEGTCGTAHCATYPPRESPPAEPAKPSEPPKCKIPPPEVTANTKRITTSRVSTTRSEPAQTSDTPAPKTPPSEETANIKRTTTTRVSTTRSEPASPPSEITPLEVTANTNAGQASKPFIRHRQRRPDNAHKYGYGCRDGGNSASLPVYATHSYNAYTPLLYVTEYQHLQSASVQKTHFSWMNHYSENNYDNDGNGNESRNEYVNENITTMFNDENPNACIIV